MHTHGEHDHICSVRREEAKRGRTGLYDMAGDRDGSRTQMQQIKLQEPLPVRCRAGSAFAMYGSVQTKREGCLPDAVRRLVVDKERKNR